MNRKYFLKTLIASPLILSGMKLQEFENLTQDFKKSDQMPVLFIGHGHPMNALFDNNFTQTLQKLGQNLPTPQAILVVSAHWETRGTWVSVNPKPQTIYDFGGFDQRLFEIKYEPKGHPTLAQELIKTAEGFEIQAEPRMGLDHGAWTVLKHIFPLANVPVFQLSIDYTQAPEYHFRLGQALQKLRKKGVLILGSGNIVHNLGRLNWQDMDAATFDWAKEFDELVKQKLDNQAFNDLVNYGQWGNLAKLAIPTPDHYLPLLYSLGLADKKESIKYIFEGFQYGSISMRCLLIN